MYATLGSMEGQDENVVRLFFFWDTHKVQTSGSSSKEPKLAYSALPPLFILIAIMWGKQAEK